MPYHIIPFITSANIKTGSENYEDKDEDEFVCLVNIGFMNETTVSTFFSISKNSWNGNFPAAFEAPFEIVD